jgi:hypothetical protein
MKSPGAVDAHVLDDRYWGSRTWLIEVLRRAPRIAPDITFVIYSNDPERSAHSSSLRPWSIGSSHR